VEPPWRLPTRLQLALGSAVLAVVPAQREGELVRRVREVEQVGGLVLQWRRGVQLPRYGHLSGGGGDEGAEGGGVGTASSARGVRRSGELLTLRSSKLTLVVLAPRSQHPAGALWGTRSLG
jgi:hypothetical protein